MEIKSYFAQDTQGNALPGATCYLTFRGSEMPVPGATDGAGAPLTSPFFSDENALIQFAAPNGNYDLKVLSGGRSYTLKVQCLDTATALNRFLQPHNGLPATRDDGSALVLGDRVLNTADQLEYIYKANGWAVNNIDGQQLALPSGATRVGVVIGDGTSGNVQEGLNYLKDSIAAAVEQLSEDNANQTDTAKGAALQGWNGRTVGSTLNIMGVIAQVAAEKTAVENAAAIQAAFLMSSRVILPAVEFNSQPIFPPSDASLKGQGLGTIMHLPNNPSRLLPSGITSKQVGLIHADSGAADNFVSNICITDMQLMGASVSGGFQEQTHLISLNGTKNTTIRNVWFSSFQGDAIYCGTGSGDSTERHNFDLFVNRCTIDGVNRENRQALSVVDGVGIWFTKNHVKNCTRSDMPGGVDIEPANGADTTQHIFIVKNIFQNVGGTSGVTGYIANHQGVVNRFIRPSININILENVYLDCTNRGGSFACQVSTLTAGPTTPPIEFTVRGNRSYRGARVGTVVGSRGVRHIDNKYYDMDFGMFLGLQVAGGNYDVQTHFNSYYRCGGSNLNTAGYGMQISTNAELSIFGEDFVDCGRADGAFGYGLYFVDGSSSGVSLSNSKIRNTPGSVRTTYAIKALGTHTFASETNLLTDNKLQVAGNDFKFKPITFGTFTFSTTPANLPVGSYCIPVTDAAFPGGKGLLESFKYVDPTDGSYAAFTYQRLTPTSSNTANTKTFHIRKPDPSTGLWQTSVVYTGV